MPWNGEERRKNKNEDHDILLRIDANLTSHMKQFEEHKKADDIRFENVEKKLGFIEKGGYGIAGVLAFLEMFWRK